MMFSQAVTAERITYAASVGYDITACALAWGIGRGAARAFILQHCPVEYKATPKPEYENQRLFDLFVLPKADWCRKWDIPLHEYQAYLRQYDRQRHEQIPTPERRSRWAQDGGV